MKTLFSSLSAILLTTSLTAQVTSDVATPAPKAVSAEASTTSKKKIYLPAEDLSYSLPTENTALFDSTPEEYYMYVDRYFDGKLTKPWEGGTYGFTRNPFRNSAGDIMYAKFHEGIDVKPVRRDAAGEPLDPVRSIAPGIVVYTNNSVKASNYGRYIVIAHRVPEGLIFSLYAHMKNIQCKTGQAVTPQTIIGDMGYTGRGLNRERAHLHLEVALMINSHYKKYAPGNIHDRFNGLNLIGVNVTDLLEASRGGKKVSLKDYFASLKENYRISVPYQEKIDLLERHPFLYKDERDTRAKNTVPKSYEISFTAEGIPIAIRPSDVTVGEYAVVKATPAPTYQQNVTAKRLMNSSKDAILSKSGTRYINLYLFQPEPEPIIPPPTEIEAIEEDKKGTENTPSNPSNTSEQRKPKPAPAATTTTDAPPQS